MIIRRYIKDSFYLTGQEGSTDEGGGFIARLFTQANANAGQIIR